MKSVDTKEKFLQLRVEGHSYQAIADTLKVSKQTLIDWSSDMKTEIHNLRSARKDALYEQFFMSKEAKIKLLGELIEKVRSELSGRDLTTVSTDRLMDMVIKLTEAISKEREELTFVKDDPLDDFRYGAWSV